MARKKKADLILDAIDEAVAKKFFLPSTNDGKVNVKKLVETLGLKTSDAQYFFKDDGVKTAINAIAEDQGLLPIGHRADMAESDRVVRERLSRVQSSARKEAVSAVESLAAYGALSEELTRLRSDYEAVCCERDALKERLALISEGIFLEP